MAKAKKTESSETPEKKTPAKAAPKATKPAAPKATKKAPAPADKPVPAAAKKPAAAAADKKAPAKAAGKKSAPTPATSSSPQIDTNLAAQTAAAMLLNRPATPAAGAPQPNKESSAFKNLKDQLAKPKPAALSNLFGPTGGSQKQGGHFNLHQQKGHNQTFGGLNKAGVPRRTNG